MIGPEAKLWQKLAEAAVLIRGSEELSKRARIRSLSRIETGTRIGVSDVEYAVGRYCGWLELKTTAVVREESKLSFHAPFTPAQYTWLCSHHYPAYYQRSWLVVGRMGARTWREWILIPPRVSLMLTQMRESPSLASVREERGVHSLRNAQEVLLFLAATP